MSEIEAMTKIEAVLKDLQEDERQRVLQWAVAKHSSRTAPINTPPQHVALASQQIAGGGKEIPGIAALTPTGEFRLTVRDLKAKSTNDAAVRLAHITIWAYQELTGEQSVSSKGVLLPILKKWRAYSGNTRLELGKQKGILRHGDSLSLDMHSVSTARKFSDEVRDDTIVGTWAPQATNKKKRGKVSPGKGT
jgi:hypothetical protein